MTVLNSIFKKLKIIIQLFFMAIIFSSCSSFTPNVKEFSHVDSKGQRTEYTMWLQDSVHCNQQTSKSYDNYEDKCLRASFEF